MLRFDPVYVANEDIQGKNIGKSLNILAGIQDQRRIHRHGRQTQGCGVRIRSSGQKTANEVVATENAVPGLTNSQIEQLLKLLPTSPTTILTASAQ